MSSTINQRRPRFLWGTPQFGCDPVQVTFYEGRNPDQNGAIHRDRVVITAAIDTVVPDSVKQLNELLVRVTVEAQFRTVGVRLDL